MFIRIRGFCVCLCDWTIECDIRIRIIRILVLWVYIEMYFV